MYVCSFVCMHFDLARLRIVLAYNSRHTGNCPLRKSLQKYLPQNAGIAHKLKISNANTNTNTQQRP